MRIFEEIDNAVGRLTALAHVAALHRDRGEFDEAERLLTRALEIALRVGNSINRGFVRGHLGILLTRRGHLDDAEAMHRVSHEDYTAARYPSGQVAALRGLGIVCQNRGELDAAERCHRASLALARTCGDMMGVACAFGNLSRVHRLLRYPQADSPTPRPAASAAT